MADDRQPKNYLNTNLPPTSMMGEQSLMSNLLQHQQTPTRQQMNIPTPNSRIPSQQMHRQTQPSFMNSPLQQLASQPLKLTPQQHQNLMQQQAYFQQQYQQPQQPTNQPNFSLQQLLQTDSYQSQGQQSDYWKYHQNYKMPFSIPKLPPISPVQHQTHTTPEFVHQNINQQKQIHQSHHQPQVSSPTSPVQPSSPPQRRVSQRRRIPAKKLEIDLDPKPRKRKQPQPPPQEFVGGEVYTDESMAKKPKIEEEIVYEPPVNPVVLPDKVLGTIFSFLPALPYYIGCRRVCKNWYEYLIKESSWENVDTLCFSGLKMENVTQEHIDYVFRLCKNGLRKLIFSDSLYDESLIRSVNQHKTLEELVLGFCVFENIPHFSASLVELPNLRKLIIVHETNENQQFTRNEIFTIVQNVPSLQELSLEWSRMTEQDLYQLKMYFASAKPSLIFNYSKKPNPEEDRVGFARELVSMFRRTGLNANTYTYIDNLIEETSCDYDTFAEGLKMGLSPNIVVDERYKDTMLHILMKEAREMLNDWSKTRREISGYRHTNPKQTLLNKKAKWDKQAAVLLSRLRTVLAFGGNITARNSKKETPLEIGKHIDSDIEVDKYMLQQEGKIIDLGIYPFEDSIFTKTFTYYYGKLPGKKRRARKGRKKKIVKVIEEAPQEGEPQEATQLSETPNQQEPQQPQVPPEPTQIPTDQMQIDQMPTQQTSTDQTSTQQATTEQVPAQQVPTEQQTSTEQQIPTQQTEQVPTQQPTAEQIPTQQTESSTQQTEQTQIQSKDSQIPKEQQVQETNQQVNNGIEPSIPHELDKSTH